MTIKELGKLPIGTRVEWRRDDERESGFTCKPIGVPLFIQWADGQTTNGTDDGALVYVFEARP